jgi:hypothetical protein
MACGFGPRFEASGKAALDQAPPGGKICITVRQLPNGVNVIGQDTDCDGLEGAALLNGLIAPPEQFDLFDQQAARPFRENNREEENASF